MRKNATRLAKLEDRLVGNRSDVFRLTDLEILERIEELEFQKGRKPTQKFMNMKKVAEAQARGIKIGFMSLASGLCEMRRSPPRWNRTWNS